MSTSVASLPNWRCRFDSGRPLQASPQVSTGEAGSQPTEHGPQVSPTVSPNVAGRVSAAVLRAEAEALRAHEAGTCHLSEWSCTACEQEAAG